MNTIRCTVRREAQTARRQIVAVCGRWAPANPCRLPMPLRLSSVLEEDFT
jgi:hypothetical protein